jgi:hypothetical protein
VILVAPLRHAALRAVGGMLVASDEAGPADVFATDAESAIPGLLALGDLHRAHPSATIALLRPSSTRVDAELSSHGVMLPDFALETLSQLGIPKRAVIQIPSDPTSHILVVVGPSHGRGYRRALRRAWPNGVAAPIVTTTQYGSFRLSDWWESRTTLREGLVEIEKLGLDYVVHPF